MRKTIKGVIWSGFEKVLVQAIQFIVSVVLARILLPEDFATIAIMLVFINIFQTISESGFFVALIQKQDRQEIDYNTIFYANVVLSILLYTLLVILSGSIGTFFKQDSLAQLIKILGLNLIISSLSIIHRVILVIKLDFKTQAICSTIAVVISGITSIWLAKLGWGVNALVIQSVLMNLLTTVLLVSFVRWFPKLKYSWDSFKQMFIFAYKLTLARLINDIFQNLYTVVIGKFFPLNELGFYNRAQSFQYVTSNNIIQIVQRVSTPILCEIQDSKEKLRDKLLEFIGWTAFIVFPLMIGVFVLSDDLIIVILTEKWLPASFMLKILCIVSIFFVFSTFNLNVLNALGRSDIALKTEIIKKTVFVISIFIALPFGFKVLLYSQIIIAIFEALFNMYFTKKLIDIKITKQFKEFLPLLIVSISMGIIVYFSIINLHDRILRIIIGTTTGVFAYFILVYLFDILSAKQYIKLYLQKRTIK